MQMEQPLLEVQNLTVQYQLENGFVKAVDDVSLIVEKGDSLGIVGESGCGKSTLAYAVMGILPDNAIITGGRVLFEGKDLLEMPEDMVRQDIRWKKISMVFQSSMNALNPVYKVGSFLADIAKFKEGMSQTHAEEKIAELYKMVDLDSSRMRNYPHQYSGGMKQRAVIAMSLICHPALVIADEPTTALDVVVQDQILKTLKGLQKNWGMSMVTISHDISVIAATCEKLAVMYGGKLFEVGSTRELLVEPNNPYTRALLDCFARISTPPGKLKGIPGEALDLRAQTVGCRFASRCLFAKKICADESPPLHELSPGHLSLCHFAKELAS